MIKIKIKPKSGTRVLDPSTTPPIPLPQEGKEVTRTSYWLRRIEEGSVEFVTKTADHKDRSAEEVSKTVKKKKG